MCIGWCNNWVIHHIYLQHLGKRINTLFFLRYVVTAILDLYLKRTEVKRITERCGLKYIGIKAFNLKKNSHFLLSSIFLGALAKLRKATISCVMSVRPFFHLSAWNNTAPIVRIFMKFGTGVFFENLLSEFQFSLKSDKDKRYLAWRPIYISEHLSFSSSRNEKYFRQIL